MEDKLGFLLRLRMVDINILNQDLYFLNLYIYTLRKTFVDSALPFSPLCKVKWKQNQRSDNEHMAVENG